MKIIKILSNNAIMVENEQGDTLVALGRGIGFGKKNGDRADARTFEAQYLEKKEDITLSWRQLFSNIPDDIIQISREIVGNIEKRFPVASQLSLILALSDHIYYAITRAGNNQMIKNPLAWDIRMFYPEEYQMASDAIALINRKMYVELPEEEIGFIALHIVNCRHNGNMYDTMQSATLIKDIINIIKLTFLLELNEGSINFQRLVTHLKFFSMRMINNAPFKLDDDSVYFSIREKFSESYRCTEKIEVWLEKNHSYKMNFDEKMFLTIHIERLRNSDA
ncbi:PRD domain-containing protein [Rahnella victoriana]|uniref:PRD domain-containing protein n=1 Tax=Rahnella victoriana TaxID=1510570 RepID=A0ABS0DUA7_9GAMM|nr:PRD domain-containing protein [Rahnella victoriana]MBF7957457.1 PRD domain-containing protein [Rahnella victoriana]